MLSSTTGWIAFNIFVIAAILFDLFYIGRKSQLINVREALGWTAVWATLAMCFAGILFFFRDEESAILFISGYVIELSLSMDNLFVFYVIFQYFGVPLQYQRRVLIWGILGALVLRGFFIGLGAVLLQKFAWMTYALALLVIYSGIRLLKFNAMEFDPDNNPALRLIRRFVPLSSSFDKDKFFVRINGKLFATPLLIVLVAIETTDLVFAVDSIPAIFALTKDPFIVYTSNVFAILGLRALFFALAGLASSLRFLEVGLAVILIFVGAKIFLEEFVHVPITMALGVIGGVLLISVVASLALPVKPAEKDKPDQTEEKG